MRRAGAARYNAMRRTARTEPANERPVTEAANRSARRRAAPRGERRAGERHRRGRELRPRARRADSAVGRRGRSADAGLHLRGGDPRARGRRDLLHLAARHSGIASRRSRAITPTLYGRAFAPEEFYVTGSGMQAIQIVLAMVAGAGDEVVIPTPTWPNAAAAAGIVGARAVEVPMSFGNGGWALDLDRLGDAVTPKTRALFLVSPSNPTGWTATREDLTALLALARRHGLVDHRRRDLCALLVWRRRARAVLLRRDGRGRPHPVRQHVLQELGDDRLAHRLDRRASLARSGDREHDPVLDLGRRAVHAARGGRGARTRRELRRASGRARAARARHCLRRRSAATGRVRFAEPQGAFYLFFSSRRDRHAAACACA